MKILVIGNGGREHAIIDALSKSKKDAELYALPGNPGMANLANLVNIAKDNLNAVVDFASSEKIDLVIVGDEASLAAGLSDLLRDKDIMVLGPSQKAAFIESSKEFAKELMIKYQIPTASYDSFDTSEEAIAYLSKKNEYPIVIKFNGLAQGKGVSIVESFQEASQVVEQMLDEKIFGEGNIIIEEFLQGDEFTLLALVNGDKVYPFQTARDFKTIFEQDQGPNTGGMGAICPYLNINDKDYSQAVNILEKTSKALVMEKRKFIGVLYGGFIKTKNGVKVIEFNARFGDPETQVVLNNLSSDLLTNILDLLEGREVKLTFKDQISVGVVLAAPGYPAEYEKGIDLSEYLQLPLKKYHMQTKDNNGIVSDGGRVLFMLNEGQTTSKAYEELYQELSSIKNHSLYYRKDLGNYVKD